MFHIMTSPFWAKKAKYFMESVLQAARKKSIEHTFGPIYKEAKYLMLYGLGGRDRQEVVRKHEGEGKHVISFDLGYWGRTTSWPTRKYRVSIDGYHPENIIDDKLFYPGPERWEQTQIALHKGKTQSVWAPNKIMLVGNAPKSISVGAQDWTAKKSREIKKQFPLSKIIYRPKPKRPKENNVLYNEISFDPISRDVKKVDLVVCRHSNVAVDACIAGTPVVCDAGAAKCIYPSDLINFQNQPDYRQRLNFLQHLAYWQWGANETELFWDWLFKTLPVYCGR